MPARTQVRKQGGCVTVQVTAGEGVLDVTRSLSGRIWRYRNEDDRLAIAISQRHGIPEILGRVLAGRGVGLEESDSFLDPTLRTLLPDPSRLRDMDKAAARLAEAVVQGETVAVFGDYDVDGATSSALLLRVFRALGRPLRLYIPDRISEGYGPNAGALRRLAAEGVSLVVTVDCGTVAHEALAAARGTGLDVIVIDHHQAGPDLPQAYAVVNPNRLDDESGLGGLAAIGVSFLLAVALTRTLRESGYFRSSGMAEPPLLDLLDLVALGTVADVVPLAGLNRAFVAQGLKVLAQRRNPGLRALADAAKLDELPGAYHLGYVLGPRVNAGGRVGRADLGARLLATEDEDEARAIAAELERHNQERRAIEAQVLDEAAAAAERGDLRPEMRPCVVATGRGWHPGVIGIVASRLRERYGRPALVIGVTDGFGKGSGRSIPGLDLGAAVTAARQAGLLVNGGGHAMAAGLTVEEGRIADLAAFLEARLGASGKAATTVRRLGIDAALGTGSASRDLLDALAPLGPHGQGNPEPRFAVARTRIVRADPVGDGHLRLILAGDEGARLKGIAFRAFEGPLGAALLDHRGRPLHMAGHLRADNWQGRRDVQLVVEDAAWAG